MRIPVMKQLKIEELEFSQNYLFFWDKIERLHYLLNVYVETARRGEPVDGRLVQHLLHNPSEDGGQWQMLVNLVEKYGVVPKKCFPDTWSSENSRRLGLIANNKMREYCKILREMVAADRTKEDIDNEVKRMMEVIYRIVSICVGSPPETVTWEFYDKEKVYQKIGPVTPLEFYRQYVQPHFNISDKVVIVNDPRPFNPYGQLYTVEYLNNMSQSPLVLYINQPADVLKRFASESIRNNEPVWFGCDVNKHCSWKKFGLEDLQLYNYDLVFGVGVHGLNKSDRLIYGESLMTHAMVLTAVHELDGKTTKWRIENSWNETGGEKGYMAMTDDWFTEYVLEVVVDKKYLPPDILEILQQQPKVLPAWDPMGALAGHRCPCTVDGFTTQPVQSQL
jgi:bleomycin hydrolase